MASHQSRAGRSGPACWACRTRKLGCDKARPSCARCREASRTCSYDPVRQATTTEYKFINETPRIIANSGVFEAGPSFRSLPTSSPDSGQARIEISASRLAEIESRLEMLTTAIKSMRSSDVPPSSSVGMTGHHTTPNEPSTDLEPAETEALGMGRLSLQGSGRARFITGSFWANICDEATAIDELLRSQTRYTGAAASSTVRAASAETLDTGSEGSELIKTNSMGGVEMFPFGDMLTVLDDWDTGPPQSSRYQRVMPDIVGELPSKALCDRLFDFFISYYHTVAPMIHIPSTKSNYHAFWQSSTQNRRTKGALYTPLIVAILFAGANACDESTITQLSSRSKGEIVVSLHKLTAKTLRYANFPRTPTIESFAAYLIIQNTCLKEEQPLTNCSYVGTAIRIAQMLGCDRDPTKLTSVTPVAAEVRRRISWQVHYLDAEVALAAGLPPLIDASIWSIHPPSELKDELIGTVEGKAYDDDIRAGRREPDHVSREGSVVSSAGIFAAGKFHATVITRVILAKLYGDAPMTGRLLMEAQEELERLKVDLISRMERLPPYRSEASRNPEETFAKWAHQLLSSLIDRSWAYLYYPLSHAVEKQRWEGTLDRVLHHSHSYLEKMIVITSLEEFGSMQWAWPGIHQPLHAVMVLLRHVDKNPDSPHSEALRQSIDEAMALCGPDGGLIGIRDGRLNRRPLREGGHEVWDLIRRLRSQAWLKAGLDPDVLLTRDEVVERVELRVRAGEELTQWSSAQGGEAGAPMDVGLGDELLMGTLDPTTMMDLNMDWLQWD